MAFDAGVTAMRERVIVVAEAIGRTVAGEPWQLRDLPQQLREMLLNRGQNHRFGRLEECLRDVTLHRFFREVRPFERANRILLRFATGAEAGWSSVPGFSNERSNLWTIPHLRIVTPPPGPRRTFDANSPARVAGLPWKTMV